MSFYTDIHTHILAGVDDGASDLSESIAMLFSAQKEHIGQIILTPHQKSDRKCVSVGGLQRRMEQLQEEADRLHIGIKLYPGSELLFDHDLKNRLNHKQVCTLAGSHYALTEFMPDEEWAYIRDGLYGLVCSGYSPVIAHVERYAQLMKNLDRVQELIDMGCYMQVNAGSIAGDWGFGMKRTSTKLLKEELIHFIGTDAHRKEGRRSPKMEKCAAILRKKAGNRYAEQILWENAEAIFADEEI